MRKFFAVLSMVLILMVAPVTVQAQYYADPNVCAYYGGCENVPFEFTGPCPPWQPIWTPYGCMNMAIETQYPWATFAQSLSGFAIGSLTGIVSQGAGVFLFSTLGPLVGIYSMAGLDEARTRQYEECMALEIANNIPLSQSQCYLAGVPPN